MLYYYKDFPSTILEVVGWIRTVRPIGGLYKHNATIPAHNDKTLDEEEEETHSVVLLLQVNGQFRLIEIETQNFKGRTVKYRLAI